MVRFGTLVQGSYRLTESKAPDGYVYDEENPFSATFVIKGNHADRTFDLTNQDDRDAIAFTVTSGKGTFDNVRGIPNDRDNVDLSSVKIKKVSKKVGSGETSTPVDGALFELRMQSSYVEDLWRTVARDLQSGMSYTLSEDKENIAYSSGTDTGILEINNLLWGTYRLVETTPALGHHFEGEAPFIEFEITQSDDGQEGAGGGSGEEGGSVFGQQSDEATGDAGSVPDEGADNALEDGAQEPSVPTGAVLDLTGDDYAIVNVLNALELLKVNEDDEPLKGAVFEIKPECSGTFADGTTEPVRATTDEQGMLDFDGMLVVGTTYQLVEMVAPDGYARISDALAITVNEDGSLSIKGPDAYTLELENGTCVVVVNQEAPYFPPWNPPDDEEVVDPDNPDNPDEPTDPDNPDNPDDPTDPDNPDNPDNPDDPTPDNPDNPNPSDPDQPGTPDNPSTPDNPNNPNTPSNSSNPSSSGSSSAPGKPTVSTPSKTTSTPSKSTAATTPVVTLARTGDPTAIAVVALNLAVALSTAVAVLVLALRNRRSRERDGS